MQAIILSIGDELVLGQTVDTNSAWLSAHLAALGVNTRYHQTIEDELSIITDAIRRAAREADVVLISGGIGPTDDDLTRQALADAMDVKLVTDQVSVEAIRAFFRGRGKEMPDRNAVQATHPVGTTMIENTCGTAPGIQAQFDRATIFVTPGVPREMKAMYQRDIRPWIVMAISGEATTRVILTTKVNTFGEGESTVAERLGDLTRRDRNPKVGTTVADGIVSIRVRSEFATLNEARSQLDDTLVRVDAALGPIVFGRDDETLETAVITLLSERKLTLVTAESCTGGLVGEALTRVPGSSVPYLGGWVTYSDAMKIDQLGVSPKMIDRHGAVSEPVVLAMAEGALRRGGADLAISVSGVAGPGGGTDVKPVGTVWLALAWRDETDPDRVHAAATLFNFGGDRDTIRDRTAKSAMQMVRAKLIQQQKTSEAQKVRRPENAVK